MYMETDAGKQANTNEWTRLEQADENVCRRMQTWANGLDELASAFPRKTPTTAWQRLPPVNRGHRGGGDGGGDWEGPVGYEPKNGQKRDRIATWCDDDHSHGTGYGWSQNKDLDEMNLFEWLASPEAACRAKKWIERQCRQSNTDWRKLSPVATTVAWVMVTCIGR